MKPSKTKRNVIIFLSIVAGILYNSWPLGYWLNPAVSKSSLASGLEATGQPYNWVFIGLDIISSIFVIIFSLLLWRIYQNKLRSRQISVILVSSLLFGVCTIFDALIPEHCVPNLEKCPSFTQDHVLLIHGLFSIMASLFLFMSFFIVWLNHRRMILTNAFLVGFILFGLITLFEAIVPGNNGNWSQHYFITLCSAWVVCTPYAVTSVARISI